ncbi:hypothetical protein KAFR_0C01880 [Kazachstania africana CBS 2517]|uniref:Uncharacterized protein n=1 Tax=Kazachstania africana (strain ATCC 22294 / BCRC 22015 / CBS 2517 / CECT 1963 / NBRC 1671 / NRRL Y-8276) TaxID=1071382 RepID=H2AS31_KAZAF|nr:hypothetical protein KAFR_0C01880 [Kazachstania africana CBS 2517]CCF57181.1 hypothetical protein KAFR_0C01880 [Kazachstania africana CBS 2517]
MSINSKEHILFFGSSGLVGSGSLSNLLNPNFLLCNKQNNFYDVIESSIVSGVYDIAFDKIIYCFNRTPQNIRYKYHSDFEKNSQFDFGGTKYTLSNNPEPNNSFESKGQLQFAINDVEERIKIKYQVMPYSKEFGFSAEEEQQLNVTYNVFHVQIVYNESEKWPDLLPILFTGENEIKIARKRKDRLFPELFKLANINDISTVVCTLGASSATAKKQNMTVNKIDYDLTYNLIRAFTTTENKKVIIVTSFNNALISNIFPYFRTKLRLENDLKTTLEPPIKELYILRPGPIKGKHRSKESEISTNIRTLNPITRAIHYKKKLIKQKKKHWSYFTLMMPKRKFLRC